jgi:chemotaxis protein methyltransferase CheR
MPVESRRRDAVSSPWIELTESEFSRFRELIYKSSGIRIPVTKRVMMSNRLRRRLRDTGIGSFAAYYTMLTTPGAAAAAEMPRFLDEITTNETYFFRDPHHFAWFGDTYLPDLIKNARLGKRPRSLRVWSAAASTGEELYSLALKLQERKSELTGWKITLLGTDLSAAVLASARKGTYDERALRLVTQDQRRLFFDHDPAAARWTVKPETRATATWKIHNLIQPLKEEPFDVILIKNVLIYFDAVSKQTVVENLIGRMGKDGYLVVGPTEGIHTMLGALGRKNAWLYQRGPTDVGV